MTTTSTSTTLSGRRASGSCSNPVRAKPSAPRTTGRSALPPRTISSSTSSPRPFRPGPSTTTSGPLGVPQTGLTWNNQCPGGFNSYCMYSPFAPGMQLPATGTALWNSVVVPALVADPIVDATLMLLGLTPAAFAAILADPTPADIASVLGRFNSEDPETTPFLPDPGVTSVDRILPTITTTFEVGYQALFADKLKLSVSVYRNQIKNFVGPLRVETPNVFPRWSRRGELRGGSPDRR